MLPAFGMPQAKEFLPMFQKTIENVVTKWKDIISTGHSGKSTVIDVNGWLARATLDAIGEAAFDYDFEAVEGDTNPLSKSYNNLMVDAYGTPSAAEIFFTNVSEHIPPWILSTLGEYLPGRRFERLRGNRDEVQKVARFLLAKKRSEALQGEGKKDVMSLLMKANASENETSRLRDDEIIPQMRTMILAGHETTAGSVAWTLYALAKHPEIQTRLREEIKQVQNRVQARGDIEFTAADYEEMPYTVAIMKESLRFYPIGFQLNRVAGQDDIIPLHKPITTLSGKIITEIPVSKGTVITASTLGYNTNKDVWGEDALEFNPERWLSATDKSSPTVGIYGNVLTFSAGVRGCIGWRFAVMEMQAFIIALISNFEFSFPKDAKRIIRTRSISIAPMVEGEADKGVQLPLEVRVIGSV